MSVVAKRWMDQDARPPCVRWGPISPKKGAQHTPQFSAHICCGQTAGWYRGRPRPRPHDIVLDGDPAAPIPKGHSNSPLFGQTAGWIKMALGREVCLSASNIVLDGDPAPPIQKTGTAPPLFGPYLLWPDGWMDQYVTWYRGMPWPRPHTLC